MLLAASQLIGLDIRSPANKTTGNGNVSISKVISLSLLLTIIDERLCVAANRYYRLIAFGNETRDDFFIVFSVANQETKQNFIILICLRKKRGRRSMDSYSIFHFVFVVKRGFAIGRVD